MDTVKQPEPIRLNIGGATGPELSGYVVVDRKTGGEAYPLRVPKWPGRRPEMFDEDGSVPANTVAEVRASHVLEHVSHRQTAAVVAEWVRVLKPGGVLKVAVPDFDWILAKYQGDDAHQYSIEGYLMGGHVDDDDVHKAIFNEGKLRALLEGAGLVDVKPWASEVPDCASLPVSLNLQGTKPLPEAPRPAAQATAVPPLPGVQAVLSMPRYAFTQQVTCLLETVYRLRIPARIRQGVFWHSTLTTAVEEAMADGAEFILTVDIDTIFKPEHVVELHRLMRAHPQAAAVCGMQVGRDRDTVLLTIRDAAGGKNRPSVTSEEVDADLLPITTGHFGLTLVRASAFRALPRPWFLGVPDPSGRWGEGRVDPDIYFWVEMAKAGLKVFQANRVALGHWQDVVTLPGADMQAAHVYAPDFRAGRIPPNARW